MFFVNADEIRRSENWKEAYSVALLPLTPALTNDIQRQLDTTRYAQLLINSEEIVADSVLSNPEPLRHVPVGHALRYQTGNFVLFLGEQIPALRTCHT